MIPYYDEDGVTIFHGDCRDVLPQMEAGSVHCCVTSPPYFQLRDYTGENQIGLEKTPGEFVAVMVDVFHQVRDVLRTDGTVWLNIGDSYCSDNKWGGASGKKNLHSAAGGYGRAKVDTGFKPKDLYMIPARVAIALQDAGWWVRSDIVWSKPNAMPEPVEDRPTRSHEYIYLLSKSVRYYYDQDAIREPLADKTFTTYGTKHRAQGNDPMGLNKSDNWGRTVETREPKMIAKQDGHGRQHAGFNARWYEANDEGLVIAGANKRDVWTVATAGFPDTHFAVFPEKLIEPCILAGCPARVCAACGAPWVRQVERESNWQDRKTAGATAGNVGVSDSYQNGVHGAGMSHDLGPKSVVLLGWQPTCTCNAGTGPGTVLDCFGGSGTTGRVAKRLGRKAILIEQNEAYCEMVATSLAQRSLWLEEAT